MKAVEVQFVNQTFEGDRFPIYACGENRYSIRKDGQLAVNCSFCLAAETETTEKRPAATSLQTSWFSMQILMTWLSSVKLLA